MSAGEIEALRRELAEARAREAATADVLAVINANPGNLAPVFAIILEKAHSISGADRGGLFLYDGLSTRGVAVHGYAGFLGVCAAGVVLWGYPSSPDALLGHAEPWARVTPWGQFAGAMIMFWGLGFIPGYALSWLLKKCNLLRIPREVELAGLDFTAHGDVTRDDEEIRNAVIQEVRAPHRAN